MVKKGLHSYPWTTTEPVTTWTTCSFFLPSRAADLKATEKNPVEAILPLRKVTSGSVAFVPNTQPQILLELFTPASLECIDLYYCIAKTLLHIATQLAYNIKWHLTLTLLYLLPRLLVWASA